ncbi:MAG TPA: hypothetical protein VJG83_00695 [archaeon]|nr:hypothetical protein [archaeon]
MANGVAMVRTIPHKLLREKIIQYIIKEKSKGKSTVADFDIMDEFNVQIEDVEEILGELEREGLVAKREYKF